MLRAGTSLALALIWGGLAVAQDSGPGPISGTGTQQYEVTVLKLGSAAATGTFDFAVTTEEPGTEPTTTTSVITTGTFTSTLGTTVTTGTWTAIDVGNFAIWFANAEGTAGSQVITGFATPDLVVGRIVTTSNSSTGRGRFLRALFNTSIFFGTAVEAETPPTEEPMTTAN